VVGLEIYYLPKIVLFADCGFEPCKLFGLLTPEDVPGFDKWVEL
jgi:hypothetical protein